ncbi:hypothetical protein OT109_11205 [Phycisphaeraceae bacterium D3-23]
MLAGCSKPPTQYLGQWEVDQADLVRMLEESHPGDSEDNIALRERFIEAHQGAAWTFLDDGTFTHDGAFPARGRYRVYDYGKDWVVVRLLPESMGDGDQQTDFDEVNAMTAQEWVDHEQQRDGVASLLIGFAFLGDDQMREFTLVVRDGKITDDRKENVIFNRVP